MASNVEHAAVFKTKLLHFKIENTPLRLTNEKKKFKRRLIFLFVDKRKRFVANLSFQEFNLVFITAERVAYSSMQSGQ